MPPVIHLGSNVFDDDAIASVRGLHRQVSSAKNLMRSQARRLRPLAPESSIAFIVTGREMRVWPGGIVCAADGGIWCASFTRKHDRCRPPCVNWMQPDNPRGWSF